jgi:hypothetical protein
MSASGYFGPPSLPPTGVHFSCGYIETEYHGDPVWQITPSVSIMFYPKATEITVSWIRVFGKMTIYKE